jgi:hypothetical protein
LKVFEAAIVTCEEIEEELSFRKNAQNVKTTLLVVLPRSLFMIVDAQEGNILS